MDKKTLRRQVRARLASVDAAGAQERSAAICDGVKGRLVANGSKVVALFSPLGDEPQVWPLVELLANELTVVLPRVEGDVMNFYSYDKDCIAPGAFGINEPQGGAPVPPGAIDAIVVPGVAFTVGGKRMGRGKGFYDKYLSQSGCRALKIGVCYREQIVPDIPTERHDVAMDVVVYK